MTLARTILDPADGRSWFGTPDNPAVSGLDGPIGSFANQTGTGNYFAKFGVNSTDWTQFSATSGFLPLSGGTLSSPGNLSMPGTLTLTGSPTNVRQIKLGDSSVYGTLSTRYSGGTPWLAHNANQPAVADSWARSFAGQASHALAVGEAGVPLRVYTSASGVADGAFASFWGSPILALTTAGALSVASSFTAASAITASSGNITATSGDLYAQAGRLRLDGSLGGFGATVRYIGHGGAANILYANAPTGGQVIFAIGEVSHLGISGSNFNVLSTKLRLDAAQPQISWNPGAAGEKWLQYMASSADNNLYIRDVVNSRMQITVTPAATELLAITSFASRLFATQAISSGSDIAAAAGAALMWTGRSKFSSPSDSVVTISNNAGTDFSRLNFGLATSAAPALRRNGANLDVVTGDATAWTGLYAQFLQAWGSFNASSATNTGGYYIGSVAALQRSGNYTYIADDASHIGFYTGNASAPANYSDNTQHIWRDRASSATWATLASSGFTMTVPVIGPHLKYGRDNASFVAGSNAGNALIYGHANADYRNAIWTDVSSGQPSLLFYSYGNWTGSVDQYLRSGSTTRPSRLLVDVSAGMYFQYATTHPASADTTITWASMFYCTPTSAAFIASVSAPSFIASTQMSSPRFTDTLTGADIAPVIVSGSAPSGSAPTGTQWIRF